MKSDIQIARETNLAEIEQIAQSVEINPKELERYGNYIAKVPLKLIDNQRAEKSNLILVTAITPTKAGNGKTTLYQDNHAHDEGCCGHQYGSLANQRSKVL